MHFRPDMLKKELENVEVFVFWLKVEVEGGGEGEGSQVSLIQR